MGLLQGARRYVTLGHCLTYLYRRKDVSRWGRKGEWA